MESRVNKSLRNTLLGISGLLINLLVLFFTKSIFIRLLGAEYNGVNGLFGNILDLLNLAELGFASAIAFFLYRPLTEGDEETAAKLMNFFSKVYRVIALIVAVAGSICIPFFPYLIAEDISTLSFSLNQLRIYFVIYLFNTVCSYLLAYNRTIVTADQNSYVISFVDNTCNIVLNIVQIILLLIYKNYYAFLTAMVLKTIIGNLIIHLYAQKKYPYIRKYKGLKLSKEEKSEVMQNVKGSFLHKIGVVIVFSTTSIIISAFVSLVDAGKYANYYMITSQVYVFINLVFNAVTASIGNLCVSVDKDYQFVIFKRMRYLGSFFTVFAFTCYICLFNDFVEIWLGSEMLLPLPVVIIISVNAVLMYMRRASIAFRDAQGFYKIDWYKPIIESVAAIGFAIGLSYVWGTFGVVLGYVLSGLLISIPIENRTLFKYGFTDKKLIKQFLNMALTMLFAFALGAAAYAICYFFPKGIGFFILKFIFCIVFSTGIFVLFTFRSEEFTYYKNLFGSLCKKVLSKLKRKTSEEKPVNENMVCESVEDENKTSAEENDVREKSGE